ncbi:MAG: 2Fe-2S iron-sulfur cluster binding domain-containing protein [Bryobacterales bacterium]|nr:2Fe-2S iron-sulfur cluster binding domain-containing protein [Bryobacterales bacterium]
MPTFTFSGVACQAAPEESVLDALLRHGVEVSNSCRAGACQSCMLRATSGVLPAASQQGLKATLVEQGYFLSCVCRPEGDLVLEPAGGLEFTASIAALERLSANVLRVRLRTDTPLEYRPGQYLTLRRADGLARSYSLASLPEDGALELHVRRAPRGRMSGWLFDEARVNEAVTVRGPAGECFYTGGSPDQPLLLAGTGTGLAPLIGILRDALRLGHRGPIHLYHGALRPEGLYLREELRDFDSAHANLHYTPVVLEGGEPEGIAAGALDKTITAAHPKLSGWRGFLCGDPGIVQLLKKKLFLAGMASRDIFADAFVEAPGS